MFSADLTTDGDPAGLGLEAQIEVYGLDSRGRARRLDRADLYGQIAADDDGDLVLSGRDRHDPGAAVGVIDVATAPAGGVPPAIVLHTSSNGKGTRNVATANTTKPGLL